MAHCGQISALDDAISDPSPGAQAGQARSCNGSETMSAYNVVASLPIIFSVCPEGLATPHSIDKLSCSSLNDRVECDVRCHRCAGAQTRVIEDCSEHRFLTVQTQIIQDHHFRQRYNAVGKRTR